MIDMASEGARLAGQIAQAEVARKFGSTSVEDIAERAGLSRATLSRFYNGDVRVQDIAAYAVEGALALPRGLLVAVKNWDIEFIRELDQVDQDDRDIRDLIRQTLFLMNRAQASGRKKSGNNTSNAS